jgi:hypothetical protein
MPAARTAACLVLVGSLLPCPALAQQRPLTESAHRVAVAQAQQTTVQPASRRGSRFWSGAALLVAGGSAIVLGTTALKSADATSGNAPSGSFDACVALQQSNPVYRGNACGVLKGPRTPVVIAGAIAAGAGATLMMLGSSSSVVVDAAGVRVRHRFTF